MRETPMVDWSTRPLRLVPIDRLVWPCHDIDPAHVHADPSVTLSQGPLHVEQLNEGSLFVHDGRHRAIRAARLGHTHISAHVDG